MNAEIMLSYLADLSANNEREWYHAHKRVSSGNRAIRMFGAGIDLRDRRVGCKRFTQRSQRINL